MRIMRAIVTKIRHVFDETAVMPLRRRSRGNFSHGFCHLGVTYLHHSRIPPSQSAFIRLGKKQKKFIIILAIALGIGLLFFWHTTLVVVIAFLTFIYFLDLLFHIFLIIKSFQTHPEIVVSPINVSSIEEQELPVYTVLCPLYHEGSVVAQFSKAIKNLDYPKRKLQVLLLTEADDRETRIAIKKLHLPSYFTQIVVPHSLPKTKPKALNYGLLYAKGKYVAVFDAEDIPEASQLKKSVIAFSSLDAKTACLQAKLYFYNPVHNLLTKVFSSEYALWFDLILSGLYSLNSLIPLGGTSNHFRTQQLKQIGGWDSFNVTEDCDLGVRLAKAGYKTALLESTTHEEANSNVLSWVRQRSRWIKGYIQTYLVHTRSISGFTQNGSIRDWIVFHLLVGGKISLIFINPIMWITTISYFILRPIIGTFIESFFPTPVLYMALFSLVVGNFLYFYAYMIGCAKRGQEGLIKYAYFVPLYWLGMSVAGWLALHQLVIKPYYWAKTSHGWHLKIVVATRIPWTTRIRWSQILTSIKGIYANLSFMMFATIAGSFFNFAFNAFAGRILSFELFGIVTLFSTLTYLLGIFENALSATVTSRVGYLSQKYGIRTAQGFIQRHRMRVFNLSLLVSLIWLILLPQLRTFFQLQSIVPLLIFTPVIILGFLFSIHRGYLWGLLTVVPIGILTIIESGGKLAVGMLFAAVSPTLVYSAIPLSIIGVSLLSFTFSKGKGIRGENSLITAFPNKFLGASLLTHLATSAFITFDMVMVKHLFDPTIAGQYALLSLVGKMIFFLGAIPHSLLISLVSRNIASKQDTTKTFYAIFGLTTAVVSIVFVVLGPLGSIFVPLLFGAKTIYILPYLTRYALTISLFTLSSTIVIYQLSVKRYQFSLISFFATITLIFMFGRTHKSLLSVTDMMLFVSSLYFISVVILHFVRVETRFVLRGIVDFLDLFVPLAKDTVSAGKKRILIFNWRDIRHCYAGGAEVYIHEVSKRWVASGNRVVLFCGNDGKCPRYEVIDGVQVYRRGGFYLVYFWAFIYYIVRFRGRFDVIVDSQNGIPFFTPLYAKESVYCLMHHVHQEVFRRSLVVPLAILASVMEKYLMPWAYRNCQFITVSRSTKFEMEKHGIRGSGIRIVNPGVDTSALRPGNKSSKPIVLYVGRLKQYKSLDVIICCAKNILTRFPNVRFVIAGDGEERERLEALAMKLRVAKNIFFMGKVSDRQKIRLYQKAWVFVNPSMMEGWGITTIEANACGTPVVAADVPGLRDSVHNPHCGFLVPHGDQQQFTDTIVRMIEDEDLRKQLSTGAQIWAAQFDWDKSAHKGLRILRA